MAPTPFEHGLALAWSDGALSKEGALMLEQLQKRLNLSDHLRAEQEEKWLSEISKGERRSFGDGDQILREWLETLSDYDSMSSAVKSMGRSALDIGLSKTGWIEAFQFADGLGLGQDLAAGIWMEEDVEGVKEWPPALDPLAIILGLAVPMSEIMSTKTVEFIEGHPAVSINLNNAKPATLSWMPDLKPLSDYDCSWGWNNEGDQNLTGIPEGDLVYSTSVLTSWIRRLISMRNHRGEASLEGLSSDSLVMPSSVELSVDQDNIALSLIVDMGDKGLVKPFASVNISDVVSANPAPDNLPAGWMQIHDSLANLLLNAIDSLPKQLLVAAGISDSSTKKCKINDQWMIVQIES